MIVVVDLELGNAVAVRNMLSRIGHTATLCSNPTGLSEDDSYIIPGVGSFDEGVNKLHNTGWFAHLQELPGSTHILGICLGMQLLGQFSTEGKLEGIARVPAYFEKFNVAPLSVPHMGWNQIMPTNSDRMFSPETPERFYFTHSYFAICDSMETETSKTTHGIDFVSSFKTGNTRGVQFHPEKSHRFGMTLLSRWVALTC